MAYNYIDNTGAIIPDTQDLLQEVQDEWKSVFGDDLDVSPSTPQGRMIDAEVIARSGVVRNNADLANQINPNLGTGVFLDAVSALSGLSRTSSTHTTVTATVTGTPGVVIYEGARAETGAGDLFECTSATTIPASGTIDAPFRSVETGSVPCPANSLTVITDTILGWDSVDNASAGILGASTQSDNSFRILRNNTLALQGISANEAIISALYDTDGVQSLSFRENTADTSQTIDGILMDAHSIYVCVNGGTDSDIAQALLTDKTQGAGYNGTVTVTTTDAVSGQSYDVKFDRPTSIPVLSRITVKLSGATGGPTSQIKQNVVDYASGLIDGENGFVVGGGVSPFELSGVAASIPGVYVQLSEVALSSDGIYQTTQIPIALDEIATITLSSVQVVIV